jgi:hypothetical protein
MQPEITLEELKKNLSDPRWRMENLYFIKSKSGKMVQFKFNAVQKKLYDGLWYRNLIPKARQLGLSTFFAILFFDQVLFGQNQTAVIIAHTEKDVKKIFKNKIKFSWDHLHPWIKKYIGEPDTNTANELTFANGSSISVALSSRSDTVNFLHISEFGYICQKYPEKAEEIVTGAMNSVPKDGIISIESTSKGREGYFYDFVEDARRKLSEGRELTTLDFKLFFFPWFSDPEYMLPGNFSISREMSEYFKALDTKHKIKLSSDQERWYIKTKETLGDKMLSEYPSTVDECFAVSTEGAYYSHEMNQVYLQNRIMHLPVVDDVPVDTAWDLGWNDMNVIICFQTVGPQIRIVDSYQNRNLKLSHYVEWMKERKYRWGRHFLPHDVEVHDLTTGFTRKQTLFDLGLTNIIVAPKLPILDGIERVRGLFSRFYFDEVRTKPIYEALGNYRKDWDAKLGEYKNNPRHDTNSHIADCFRVYCSMWTEEPIFANEWDKIQHEKQMEQSFFS